MRLALSLPFGVELLSRTVYTKQEAEDIIPDYPVGFQIVDEEEARGIINPIYFPIVEANNNAGSC